MDSTYSTTKRQIYDFIGALSEFCWVKKIKIITIEKETH